MTNTQHTQGPWKHHKSPAVGGGTLHVIHAGTSITIGTIRAGIDKGNSDRIDEICEANAHLIAAAPDLLAALIAFDDAFSHYCEGDPDSDEVSALYQARAALAQATGETA